MVAPPDVPRYACAKHGVAMTPDGILLKALEGGPVTVKDITKHLERPVRIKLDKLRVRGVVIREGRGGAHRQFTCRLLRPDIAAKALGEKGGLARPAKVTPDADSGPMCEPPSSLEAGRSPARFHGIGLMRQRPAWLRDADILPMPVSGFAPRT